MTTYNPLPSKTPKAPKWGGLFPVAVVLMLLGGGTLLVYAATRSKSPASATQVSEQYSTDAANTLAAMQTASTATQALFTDTPSGPTATGFPILVFTPPDTTSTPATATPVPTAIVVSTCNNAAYVSDVTIPDNTVEAPGASFVKTWELQNNGTCTWDTSFKLAFAGGDQMGGTATAMTASVAPSQQVQVSVTLTAPTTAGTYTGYWRMVDDSGNGFGGSVTVVIVVTGTYTSTPTGTLATSTPTPVYTSTSTPVLTNTPVTPVPTSTPTTPVATSTPTTPVPTNPPVPTRTPRPTRTPVPPTAVPT
jgi:methionine-rich copper-binding protein CopC